MYLYWMVLSRLNFFYKWNDFDFVIVNVPFLEVLFHARHHMVFIFLNLFVLLECPVMSMTLILVIKF